MKGRARHVPAALAMVLAVIAAVSAPAGSSPRIVGGADATITQHPWQVALMAGSFPFCGGSLVAPRAVLTAAHCVTDEAGRPVRPSRQDVVSGQASLSASGPADRTRVIRVLVHPDYDPARLVNDIALLRLARAAPGGQPVALFTDPSGPAHGEPAVITGWGRLSTGGPQAERLQAATVEIIGGPRGRCGDHGAAYQAATMLCAGLLAGGVDACRGDSGGPLTVTRDARPYLAGITSWGVGCAEPDLPGVYTRVSSFAAWVGNELAPTPPTSVRRLGVVRSADGHAELTWRRPLDHGGRVVTDYRLRVRPVGAVTWTTVPDGQSAQRTATITGLGPGAYEFAVAAVNVAGRGPWRTVSA